jgi:hypothetical protein
MKTRLQQSFFHGLLRKYYIKDVMTKLPLNTTSIVGNEGTVDIVLKVKTSVNTPQTYNVHGHKMNTQWSLFCLPMLE